MPSGMTMMQRYAFTEATKAQAMPALPVEHSRMVIPGLRSPRFSASPIIAR